MNIVAAILGLIVLLYIAVIVATVKLADWMLAQLFPPRRPDQQQTGD